MHQLNNVLIEADFALYVGKRTSSRIKNSTVHFPDGSHFDFITGSLVDTKSGTEDALIAVRLVPGSNKLSFGSLNNNPQKLAFGSPTLNIDYPGKVEIFLSDNAQIIVAENQYCRASMVSGTTTVSKTDYVEITIERPKTGSHGNFTNINSVNGDSYPVLQIWAPRTTNLTGETTSIQFTELGTVDIVTESFIGLQAISVTVKSQSLVSFNCPKVLGDLKIVTNDKILFLNDIVALNIFLSTNDKISSSFALHCNRLEVKTTDSVAFTSVNTADLNIETTGKVTVNNGSAIKVVIDTTDKVTLILSSCESCTVKTTDRVEVTIMSGKTELDIDTTDKVTVTLDIAVKVKVNTTDRVGITANQYLSQPKVDTCDKVTIK